MKLRHHRKRKSVLMLRRARVHGFIASAARGFASFMDRMLADRFEDHMLDALKYGFSAFPYQQEFIQSLELSPAEQAAREVVQDAERFDRTLDHYVRPGGLEAIPAPHHMEASRRFYEQRIRQACQQHGPEARAMAKRYSASREYEQWLRRNLPEVRR